MRSLVLLIVTALVSTSAGQERFLYGALPAAYNQPDPAPFYFNNGYSSSTGNPFQQPFGNNNFPSTTDRFPQPFNNGSPQPFSNGSPQPFSNGSPQQFSNGSPQQFSSNKNPQFSTFTSFPQTIGLEPFGFPLTAGSGYQQPFRPFEDFGRFGTSQQYPVNTPPFFQFPQNNQGFYSNQGSAPPQFFPTAFNQPFGQSPFRNIPTNANQIQAQRPQFPSNSLLPQQQPPQQSTFPTNNPFPQTQTSQFPSNSPFPQSQPQQTGTSGSTPSSGNQLRPIKGIFGPGQPGQFDSPKEYILPL